MMCALLAKQAWKSKRDVVRRVDMNDTSEGHSPYSYADAGVSIAAGNALVKAIAPLARATRRPGADADLGGFGGLVDLQAAGFPDSRTEVRMWGKSVSVRVDLGVPQLIKKKTDTSTPHTSLHVPHQCH